MNNAQRSDAADAIGEIALAANRLSNAASVAGGLHADPMKNLEAITSLENCAREMRQALDKHFDADHKLSPGVGEPDGDDIKAADNEVTRRLMRKLQGKRERPAGTGALSEETILMSCVGASPEARQLRLSDAGLSEADYAEFYSRNIAHKPGRAADEPNESTKHLMDVLNH